MIHIHSKSSIKNLIIIGITMIPAINSNIFSQWLDNGINTYTVDNIGIGVVTPNEKLQVY